MADKQSGVRQFLKDNFCFCVPAFSQMCLNFLCMRYWVNSQYLKSDFLKVRTHLSAFLIISIKILKYFFLIGLPLKTGLIVVHRYNAGSWLFKVDFSLEMILPHCIVDGMENSARGWTWGALYWRLRLLSIRSFVRLPRRWQLCYKRWQQSTNKACKQCTSSFLYSIDTFAASLTSYQYTFT